LTISKGRYALPVNEARIYGSYIRLVCNHTGSAYQSPVLNTGALFDTRTYGPYIRVSKNASVYTAQHLRAAFTGSAYRP